MTTFIFGPDDIDGSLLEDLSCLESLHADLERIREGRFPTHEEIEQAPLLENYRLGIRERPCLRGTVERNAKLGRGATYTSELWVLAEPLGWARTLSRLYRLGKPAIQRRRS
jgi:hypothetical protein